MFCTKCGTKLEQGAAYCPNCGKMVDMEIKFDDTQNHPNSSTPGHSYVSSHNSNSNNLRKHYYRRFAPVAYVASNFKGICRWGFSVILPCILIIIEVISLIKVLSIEVEDPDIAFINAYLESRNGTSQENSLINDQLEDLSDVDVGSVIRFGFYEQDNNGSNGREEVEWIVLDKENGRILVISRYALECVHFNESNFKRPWKRSDIRSWLNDGFYNVAFSADLQDYICTTTNYTNADSGRETEDRLFLLSDEEAMEYFESDEERMCVPTAYAAAHGLKTSNVYSVDGRDTCYWWLRSEADDPEKALAVLNNGTIGGMSKYSPILAVRPVMWIDLNP